jgi:hypothetical protein
MLLFGMVLFAQGDEAVPPDDIIEWVSRFPEMIGSFWGVVVSVTFLVPVLIGLLNQTEAKKIVKYLIMGFVTAVLIVLASVLEMGYLNGAYLWYIILNGAAVIGAQIFGYALFHDALDRVAEKFNPWKPTG